MKEGDTVLPEPLIVTEVDPLLTTTWGGIRWSTESLTPVTSGPLQLFCLENRNGVIVQAFLFESTATQIADATGWKVVPLIAYRVLPQHPAESAEEKAK